MATGRTVRSALAIDTDQNPCTIVDLGGRVLVQPIYGGATGRVVTDAGATSTATDRFPSQAFVFPAIGAARLWASDSSDQANRLDLLTMDGASVRGGSVTLPDDLYAESARSDGGLAILVDGADGTYLMDGGEPRRITTGTLLARSDAGWLVQECDDAHRCGLFLVDRRSGSRTRLGAPLANPGAGSISPDGRRAVVFENRPDGTVLVVLDLRSGALRRLNAVSSGFGPISGGGNIAWAPDSRWIVTALDTGGRVVGVDTGTGDVVPLSDGGQSATVIARYR